MEATLRKILLRVGEGEYNPDLQIVTMDGFNAASTGDIDQMKRPQLDQLAKGNIPGYRALKVEALRAALKKFMTDNPGIIQIPGSEIQQPPSSNLADIPMHNVAASNSTTTAVSVETEGPLEAMEVNPEVSMNTTTCACMECEEAAVSWCELCQLSFCQHLHATHNSHKLQTKKSGKSSAFDWENANSMDEVIAPILPTTDIAPTSNEITTFPLTESKKRKAPASDIGTNQQETIMQPSAVANSIFRLEGDNAGKRAVLEKEKHVDAIKFIESLRDRKTLDYNIIYQKFNYQNYYDVQFICSIADTLRIDLSKITCKKRYSHKELLNCFINELIK